MKKIVPLLVKNCFLNISLVIFTIVMQQKPILDNTLESDNTFNNSKKGLPQFVIIRHLGNRQIKIPCANQAVADKLMISRNAAFLNHSEQTAKTTAIA